MNTDARTDRRASRGWRSYAAGAAVVTALLACTACQPDVGGGSDKAGASDRPGAAEPDGTASRQPDRDDTDGASGTVAACSEEHLAVSSEREPASSKEARHLLLTVQNTGEEKCALHHYPHVMIGDAAANTPVIKDSSPDPGKPVVIGPAEEAHAALLVAGGARDEYEAKSITLTLHGPELGTTGSEPIDVPMPAGTLYADDGQLVTYWTTASGGALDFIMSK
ncbi:DUF4232 domain-containing protein [Streptomyces griseoflavus]|uniref:DUF4232 domain-containing protein n=1 Tax=Streptomyces griseoflavus TaxID=35619 RepID=UPI0033FC6FB8